MMASLREDCGNLGMNEQRFGMEIETREKVKSISSR